MRPQHPNNNPNTSLTLTLILTLVLTLIYRQNVAIIDRDAEQAFRAAVAKLGEDVAARLPPVSESTAGDTLSSGGPGSAVNGRAPPAPPRRLPPPNPERNGMPADLDATEVAFNPGSTITQPWRSLCYHRLGCSSNIVTCHLPP